MELTATEYYAMQAYYYALGRIGAGEDIPGSGNMSELDTFGELWAEARIAFETGASVFLPSISSAWDAFHATNAGSIHRLH
jgi:hypothetical protein